MGTLAYLCLVFSMTAITGNAIYAICKKERRKIVKRERARKGKIFKAAVNKAMRDFQMNEERKELMQNALLWSREVQGMYAKGENR